MSKEEKYYSKTYGENIGRDKEMCPQTELFLCPSTFAECAIREYCSRRVTSNVKDNR